MKLRNICFVRHVRCRNRSCASALSGDKCAEKDRFAHVSFSEGSTTTHTQTQHSDSFTHFSPPYPLFFLDTHTYTMTVDLDKWIEKVKQCQHLPEQDLKKLCNMVRTTTMIYFSIHNMSATTFFFAIRCCYGGCESE